MSSVSTSFGWALVFEAVLAVSEGGATVQRSSRYRPDGFTERLKLIRVGSRSVLEGVLRDNLHHYTNKKVTDFLLFWMFCRQPVCFLRWSYCHVALRFVLVPGICPGGGQRDSRANSDNLCWFVHGEVKRQLSREYPRLYVSKDHRRSRLVYTHTTFW